MESDVQKVPRFSALDPVVQQQVLEATLRRLQEFPQGKVAAQATLKARMPTLLGHQPEQMHLDLVETAVTQERNPEGAGREGHATGVLPGGAALAFVAGAKGEGLGGD